MGLAETIFWISLFVLLYTYIGYALLLFIFNWFKGLFFARKAIQPLQALPSIALIVPSYNEAANLKQKIENCLQILYPADKLQVIIITDGSTDASNSIVKRYPQVTLLQASTRQGKMAAINRAVAGVQAPWLLFSDANTLLNNTCIQKLLPHIADQHTGGIAGEKKIRFNHRSSIELGEGLYWKYESTLKKLDSDFNTVVGAAGELFCMRTSLFTAQPEDTLLDDFILSAAICLQGYKVAYEPGAFALEEASANLAEERKRRVRIAAGAFQSLFRLPGLLNIFKHPLLSFQYISRRVFRWLLCPVALVALFITNLFLFVQQGGLFANLFFIQIGLYVLVATGWLFYRLHIRFPILFVPFYFVFMNVSLVQGFFKYITGKQSVLWEKSKRSS